MVQRVLALLVKVGARTACDVMCVHAYVRARARVRVCVCGGGVGACVCARVRVYLRGAGMRVVQRVMAFLVKAGARARGVEIPSVCLFCVWREEGTQLS